LEDENKLLKAQID